MIINSKKPKIKEYSMSHFEIGDVIMDSIVGHYYLVVTSENNKKQLVDLTDNKICRTDGIGMSFIPTRAELNVKDVG